VANLASGAPKNAGHGGWLRAHRLTLNSDVQFVVTTIGARTSGALGQEPCRSTATGPVLASHGPPMSRSDLLIYEYACHEGNHDFSNILSGARNLEKEADAAVKTGSERNPR
jgi:hypothetical protein